VRPELTNSDIPLLDSLLRQIADLVEDREQGRPSFTEHQLEEKLTIAGSLARSLHIDLPAHESSPDTLQPQPDNPLPPASDRLRLPIETRPKDYASTETPRYRT